MRYSARATQNHASCARMDACRRYIFADCANISVEAGSETFARRTWRKVSATMRQTVFNFIETERWESDFSDFISQANVARYHALVLKSYILFFAKILKKPTVTFELEVIRYRALLAKSKWLKSTRSVTNFLKADYNSREKCIFWKKYILFRNNWSIFLIFPD